MSVLGATAVACWLFLAVVSIVNERHAARLLRERREREQRGVLLEVGATVVLNGTPMTVYRIDGSHVFTSSSIFTERVQ